MTESNAPMEQPQNPSKEEEQDNSNVKSCLKAFGFIVIVFALITILCRTLPSEDTAAASVSPESEPEVPQLYFNRIATFLVCSQLDENCNVDDETVAEIVVPSEDGNTLVYTDAASGVLGFIDISDPANPGAAGVIDVGGEPTSVGVVGDYAVVTVATSASFTEPSGIFHVIDIASQEVLRTGDLGGQPDAVAVSPDGDYVAIAIENERDEDLNDGLLPQLPAGFLVIMDTASSNVEDWSLRDVSLTGLDGVLYPDDPEPEFVAINDDNIVAITLQENNAIVLVDLPTGEVLSSFTAGSTSLEGIDVEKNGLIEQTGSLTGLLREPDAITWIGNDYFATADEGDLDGGSRTFTIFDKEGNVVYDSGTELEDWVVRLGHHNEGRAGKKGNEPETVHYGKFGDQPLLFVNSERSSLSFVYDVSDVTAPVLLQVLPAGVGPEGVSSIPSRNLVVLASEVDERGAKIRSSVKIFELQDAPPAYPSIWSAAQDDGKFIPFSALSALAASGSTLYSVEDSFFKSSRIFSIDTTTKPYEITTAMRILDGNGALGDALAPLETTYPGVGALLLNDDQTVNLDLEGIEVIDGGFWVVSEGRGTVGDESRPLESPNLLLRLDEDASIEEVVLLPDEVNGIQVRFGFEGIAVDGDNVVVTVQRAWVNETSPRLGIYNTASMSWRFVFYPLDEPESQNGGWVGLSDIESLGAGQFLILERDNQGGPDAAIKRVYSIDLGDYSFEEETLVSKTLVKDLMPDLVSLNGIVFEKVEGLAVDGDGNMWINNDNDGVDDNSGENLLLNVGPVA